MTRSFVALVVALAACSNGYTPPGPGSTPAGAMCSGPADCECWQCDCQGIDGPGAAQLCNGGVCPSGEQACGQVCAIVHAKVAKATSIDNCPGRLQ